MIAQNSGQDYSEFYESFQNRGFHLIISLAEGGSFTGHNKVIVDGQPQYMRIKSAKVYGF